MLCCRVDGVSVCGMKAKLLCCVTVHLVNIGSHSTNSFMVYVYLVKMKKKILFVLFKAYTLSLIICITSTILNQIFKNTQTYFTITYRPNSIHPTSIIHCLL